MEANKRLKQGIFIAFVLLLFLPLLQKSTHLFDLKPLNGAFVSEKPDTLTINSWFSGNYQIQTDKYLNEHFGFRSSLVRLHNQINFSLFDKNNVSGTVIGKNNFLFQRPYIDSYYGNDFVGEDKILEMAHKTKKVQDTLKALGVPFIPVIAPGKAWFYSEYIPDYLRQNKGTTNYDRYKANFEDLGVDFLDLQQWLFQVKDTASFAIFPQYGIHWSNHVGVLVQDTLLKTIDAKTLFSTPKLVMDDYFVSYEFDEKEYDIMTVMNLMHNPKSDVASYTSSYHNEIPVGGRKINLLTIGDSFYNQFSPEFETNFCEQSAYWYYNKTIVTKTPNYPTRIEFVDLQKEIKKLDALVLLLTEANLKDYAFGFIDKLYSIYFEQQSFALSKAEVVNMYEDEFRASAQKMEYMRAKAEKEGVDVDTMIKIDAVWLYENHYLPSLGK